MTVDIKFVYFNNKIIVTESLRKTVFKLLQVTHLSSDKEKCMAKNIFYWPEINSDINNLTEDCMICHTLKIC